MSGADSAPDDTAVRVALWRALHLEVDAPPHVLTDDVGLALVRPDASWRSRGDMNPIVTSPFRASIVGRARFLDDLVLERTAEGVDQYVVLGSGLDTFAQRHREAAVTVFEIDQPGTQRWKQRRLAEEGYPPDPGVRFVAVDFEAGDSWLDALRINGFDVAKPAVVSSTGVSMYLTHQANQTTLRSVAALAVGTELVMTFILPVELLDDVEGPMLAGVEDQARDSGTPFISHYSPDEIVENCLAAGFSSAQVIDPDRLADRYFADRTDGLRPASAEQFVVARV